MHSLTTVHTSLVTLTSPIAAMMMADDVIECNFWLSEERIKEFVPMIIFYYLSTKIPFRMGLGMRLDNLSKYGEV